MGKKAKTTHSSSKNGDDVAVISPPKSAGKKKPVPRYTINEEQYHQFMGILDNRELLRVLTEVRNGNFSVRMPFDQVGISGKICDTLNDIISMNEKMMQEFMRAGNTIGKQGKLTQRIE